MSASQAYRRSDGRRIDVSKHIEFTFNGKRLQGYEGDTLASALLANGIRIVSRSFKYHRPRGVFSAGVEEPNALLGVDVGNGMIPVSRATLTPLIEGLRAESQNCFPSVRFDVGRVLDYTHRFWPAGFYNKTFKWPNWHTYEWAIRRSAGLGVLPEGEDYARYRHMNAHCDVLVVGAGEAGVAAAEQAAREGKDVILVEQEDRPSREIEAHPNLRTMLSSTVAGYYDHNVLTIHDRSAAWRGDESIETFWIVRAGHVVLATGAIEQPLMFGNNDLPGVMQVGAMLRYAGDFGVHCGDRIVAAVNNNLAWHTALELRDMGANVTSIIDRRTDVESELIAAARERDIVAYCGANVLAARGSSSVSGVNVHTADGGNLSLDCDALAVSGGLDPTVHLYSQAGGKLRYDESRSCFLPESCSQSVEVVGLANGDFGESYDVSSRDHAAVATGRQWVDYLHDVTVADLELAVRENFVSVEHLKRYTTTGMAVDQGKTSNLNALTVLGKLTDRAPGDVGTTTFRPQFMPVTIGAIGGHRRGENYAPPRLLPAHDWHVQHGAVFDDYGGWKRPAFYGKERERCIEQESLHVRRAVGIFDGSPLGKIEVRGPDAAEFLNLMYVNTVPTLRTGKVRYGLMLNENGVIIDDGVFIRLAADHFLVNSTSGAADRISAWLEEWRQCEYPHMDVVVSAVTSQWAVVTVAGPRSRQVLESLPGMANLSTDSLPHLSFTRGTFDDGVPYRLQRVSFTGEQSYELSVPAQFATTYFERVTEIGEPHGIAPFGLEALLLLRTEKGFLHVGVDTDATTNPLDVGFGGIVANKKTDFVGARSLQRPEDRRTDRRQLVGFEVLDKEARVLAGAHFVTADDQGQRSEGFVTSAYASPTVGKMIGLGLLERGFERNGDEVRIFDSGVVVPARIVDACFYDPDGEKMRA